MPCGVKEREKMFLMESFSGKQSASRRETFTCISWDREVGIFLKKATALSLPGDSKGWVRTLQDRAMCWDPPASGRVLTSVSAGKTPPLPLPGMLCPVGVLLRTGLKRWVPFCSLTTCTSLVGKQPAREGLGPGASCSVWRTGKKRCVGSRNGGPGVQLLKGTENVMFWVTVEET